MTTIPQTTTSNAPANARDRFFANAALAEIDAYTTEGWQSRTAIAFDMRDVSDWRDKDAVAKALGLGPQSGGPWLGQIKIRSISRY